MATLVSLGGNFTAAGSWATADATAENDSEAGSVQVTPSFVDSATWSYGASPPTVGGVALKLASRAASPGAVTLTVTLRNTTDNLDVETLTVNVSDLPAAGNGWHFFKFATSPALATGKNYSVRLNISSGTNQCAFYRNATTNNWCRLLRTTTTAAPAANDKLMLMGEYTGAGTHNAVTITMDNTATTSFGPTVSGGPPQGITISNYGTLDWGVAASTAYYLKWKGVCGIYSGGTLSIATAGTPLPASSSATLFMDCAAAGDSGLTCFSGGSLAMYGAVKTPWTLMTVDKAAGATVITLADTTGWAAGDSLAFASTSRTAANAEKKTILTVDSPTQVTLTAGLTNAHSGTAPTQAEVANLTRNIVITGASPTLVGWLYAPFTTVGSWTMKHVEITNCGKGTTNQHGLETAVQAGGTLVLYGCAFHDCTVGGITGQITLQGSSNGANIQWCVGYLAGDTFFSTTATTGAWTFSSNCVVRNNSNASPICNLSDVGGTFDSNHVTSGQQTGVALQESGSAPVSFAHNVIHSNAAAGNAAAGLYLHGPLTTCTFLDLACWRNNNYGILWDAGTNSLWNGATITFDTCDFFGNAGTPTTNFHFGWTTALPLAGYSFIFTGCKFAADTTFAVTTGLQFHGSNNAASGFADGNMPYVELISCTFGGGGGIRTTHGTGDIAIGGGLVRCYASNTSFLSTTPVAWTGALTITGTPDLCFVASSRQGAVADTENHYSVLGAISRDATIYNTAAPSARQTPSQAAVKLAASVRVAAVNNGSTLTVGVWVRKSVVGDGAAYNGNQPRLVVKANPAMGYNADTVIATASAAAGSWELLSATTVAATDDGAFEFVVDCDGTAGWINVDDWSAV